MKVEFISSIEEICSCDAAVMNWKASIDPFAIYANSLQLLPFKDHDVSLNSCLKKLKDRLRGLLGMSDDRDKVADLLNCDR